jgi:branched-chain amino acid transport system ATP-binding protein
MTILALKNVSKSFGALKVTDDVSFEVPEGEALGSSGPMARGSRPCST